MDITPGITVYVLDFAGSRIPLRGQPTDAAQYISGLVEHVNADDHSATVAITLNDGYVSHETYDLDDLEAIA